MTKNQKCCLKKQSIKRYVRFIPAKQFCASRVQSVMNVKVCSIEVFLPKLPLERQEC
jgi:hypothetical protein